MGAAQKVFGCSESAGGTCAVARMVQQRWCLRDGPVMSLSCMQRIGNDESRLVMKEENQFFHG